MRDSAVGDGGGHGEVQLEGDVGHRGEEGNPRGFQSYVAQRPRHPSWLSIFPKHMITHS